MKNPNLASPDTFLEMRMPFTGSLCAQDAYFQFMVEQLSLIVFTLDAQGRFTYLNKAWQDSTGYDVAGSLDKHIGRFVHPDDYGQCAGHLQSDVPRCCFDAQFLTKDGQALWFEMHLQTCSDGHKLGSLVNVTARINAVHALQASKERFRLAAAASNDGIWDWNLLTDEIYFSPRLREMLGYTHDELKNCYASWYDRIHPDDLDNALISLMSCLGGRQNSYESVYRLKNKDGGWGWFLDRGAIIRDAEGKGLRITGSHADITKLKVLEDGLLEWQNHLNALFAVSPDGIVTFNSAGKISSASPSFLAMTGFSFEELMQLSECEFTTKMAAITLEEPAHASMGGLACQLLKMLPRQQSETDHLAKGPENSPLMAARHQQALLSHPPKPTGWPLSDAHQPNRQTNPETSYETRKKTGHAEPRIIRVTVCQLAHEPISKVMYFRDVTLESQVDKMKNDFFSAAAYELRTPLTSIYGYAELLLASTFDPKTHRDMLHNIKDQAAFMLTMVNNVLDMTKLESGDGKTFKFMAHPLEAVVREAVEEFMASVNYQDGDINIIDKHYWVSVNESGIEVDPADGDYWAYIDASQIKHAVSNIISNAFKYSPLGAEVSISLSQRNTDGQQEVGVRIKDNGVGMTVEQIRHIYERFWRGANTRHIAGTGLGMSLVKKIMDLHKGIIEINSTPHQGTEISLWFKQAPASRRH